MSDKVTFSIIVATMGRPSLRALLQSIADQPLMPGDEVLVIGDLNHGIDPGESIVHEFGRQFFYHSCDGPKGAYGGPQRNLGLTLAGGTHLNYQDDDDLMAPGALAVMRSKCEEYPKQPLIFRMRWPDGNETENFVGGQCFVCPNTPYKVGFFSYEYSGDQNFIQTTMNKYANRNPVSIPHVITLYSGQHR